MGRRGPHRLEALSSERLPNLCGTQRTCHSHAASSNADWRPWSCLVPPLYLHGAAPIRHHCRYLPTTCRFLRLRASLRWLAELRWRPQRLRLGLGPPWSVWAATMAYLGALVLTYAVGTIEIRLWLNTSLQRTMVFPELALFSEMAVWCAIGGAATAGHLRRRWLPHRAGPSSASTWGGGSDRGESLE